MQLRIANKEDCAKEKRHLIPPSNDRDPNHPPQSISIRVLQFNTM